MNCGFELPYPGGAGTLPTDWFGAHFTGFEAVDTGTFHTGVQSMRIANDEFQGGEPLDNGAAILWQNFSDTLGQTYTLSFWLYNGDPSGAEEQFQAFWSPQSEAATQISGTPLFLDTGSAPNSWVEHTYTVTGTGWMMYRW